MELHTPTHGSMDCLSNGRQCNFKCEEGYTMAGFHRKVCMGKKGGWKPSKPVLCHGEDSLEMGMIEMSKVSKNDHKIWVFKNNLLIFFFN
jgi:hypothetical protein